MRAFEIAFFVIIFAMENRIRMLFQSDRIDALRSAFGTIRLASVFVMFIVFASDD